MDAEGLTHTWGDRERERGEMETSHKYLTRFLGFILAIRLTPFDQRAGRILQLFHLNPAVKGQSRAGTGGTK
jgi:hypothetical protein